MSAERVIVVGAGIGGLAAAFRLQEAGFEVVVLEAADHVGGRMWTVERDGFRVDTGAMLLSSRYTEMLELVADAGLASETQKTSNVIGYVRDGEVHRMNTTSAIDPLRTKLLSTTDKLAMGRMGFDLARWYRKLDTYDLARAVPMDSESVEDYAARLGFSPGARECFLGPTVMSLTFGDSEEMSKVGFLWALKRVFGGGFFSSPNGVGFLPAGLARQLDVRLNTCVEAVEEVPGGVRVSHASGPEEADAAVIAVPSPVLGELYPQLGTERARLLDRLRYSRSMHVHFGVARPPEEPSAMVYSSTRRHGGLGLTFFEHNKAPGRVPAGKGLLSTYWHEQWSKRHWDEDDNAVVAVARESVAATFPGALDEIEMAFVSRSRDCVVVNDLHLCAEQARFAAACDPRSRVQLSGDYFSCSSTNTSLCLGQQAARRLVAARGGLRQPVATAGPL